MEAIVGAIGAVLEGALGLCVADGSFARADRDREGNRCGAGAEEFTDRAYGGALEAIGAAQIDGRRVDVWGLEGGLEEGLKQLGFGQLPLDEDHLRIRLRETVRQRLGPPAGNR
ncbi:MAG: hypothetical protein B7Z66_12180 [Chromatiales bacterium 21-64-14]|nr:MAG: hypothetical protein B7Z66_12180 [Chromatiales bacterium 21-64-14]